MTIVSAVGVTDSGQSVADRRDPVYRISQLLDPGSLQMVHQRTSAGVAVARGQINDSRVLVYCTDATASGGAIGVAECPLIVDAIDSAVRECCPVIGIWHSGGAKLSEGVAAMDGIGQMFAAMVRASGRVLQLSLVLGPAAGGAAYGPALTDLVIMSDEGRVFVTGPDVVRAVTGERIDMNGLGGPEAHGGQSKTKVISGHSFLARRGERTMSARWLKPYSMFRKAVPDFWNCSRNGHPTSLSGSAGSAGTRSAWSPTTRCAKAVAWTRFRRRRRRVLCACATDSVYPL